MTKFMHSTLNTATTRNDNGWRSFCCCCCSCYSKHDDEIVFQMHSVILSMPWNLHVIFFGIPRWMKARLFRSKQISTEFLKILVFSYNQKKRRHAAIVNLRLVASFLTAHLATMNTQMSPVTTDSSCNTTATPRITQKNICFVLKLFVSKVVVVLSPSVSAFVSAPLPLHFFVHSPKKITPARTLLHLISFLFGLFATTLRWKAPANAWNRFHLFKELLFTRCNCTLPCTRIYYYIVERSTLKEKSLRAMQSLFVDTKHCSYLIYE